MNKHWKTKRFIILLGLGLSSISVHAENIILNGRQHSEIRYQLTQKIEPSAETMMVFLSFVEPASFSSPTYNQKISEFNIDLSPQPIDRREKRDLRGNKVIRFTWEAPLTPITATISVTALNSVMLSKLNEPSPFPPSAFPKEFDPFLQPSQLVNSDHPAIREKAKTLTASAKSQFEAVQSILIWILDHMKYDLIPERYDSLYSFQTGKGNCQNYSHLAAALMRSLGIPVRIVNGISMEAPYDIRIGYGVHRMKMAEGRHSWIDVYFPQLKWVTFDPQVSEFFVSNRYIRTEVGVDNAETKQDGLVSWSQLRRTSPRPDFQESIQSEFLSDMNELFGRKPGRGPQATLLKPEVDDGVKQPLVAKQEPEIPPEIKPEVIKPDAETRTRRLTFGNLDFPEDMDFLSLKGPVQHNPDGTLEIHKSFLVETAEYVTTMGQQYAQIFEVSSAMTLKSVGLALHKFNDKGQLWIELYKDKDGQPTEYIATSTWLFVRDIPYSIGYSWVDFDFSTHALTLDPGRYWIALGFTDGPIINWFFTYGKPVGPAEGTKYKLMFDEAWSRSLSYEFNYRVQGIIQENNLRPQQMEDLR